MKGLLVLIGLEAVAFAGQDTGVGARANIFNKPILLLQADDRALLIDPAKEFPVVLFNARLFIRGEENLLEFEDGSTTAVRVMEVPPAE